MGTEAEHASGSIQTTVAAPSTASTTIPKTSMFGKKSGFVIPKNKLSGSLVPVYRGPKKGDTDLMNKEATKQVQRKTKWGPDLTMDTTVRKGRASAYQTRIDQIAQQLALGILKLEDNEDSFATSESHSEKTSDHQLSHEESEQLELERREIIGELLKLNPTYKAPSDYKPLLKEAKVPIPIKEYPGYNFIGYIFGASSDTQKRLEKETGAKIQVYGIKADTGGKVEITPSDGKEIDNNDYKDMYVHLSADTFEKVDAAVALIELLVTPVSVNPVSSTTSTSVSDSNTNTNLSQSTHNSMMTPALINQGPAQQYTGPLTLPQGPFPQYPQAWFSSGPPQAPRYPNASGPLIGNTVQVSSSSFNPTNMPSLFGPRPVMPASFSPVLQNPQAPQLVQSGGPRNTHFPILQSPTGQHSLTGPPYNARPAMSISPQFAPVPPPASQNVVSGGPVVNIPNNFSPLSGPSQSSGPSAIGPGHPAMPQVGMHAQSAPGPSPMHFQMQSSAPLPQPGMPGSFSGNAPDFDSLRPVSGATLRPQHPSSSDFTFQPHRPPNAPSQVWQGNQTAQQHHIRHLAQTGQTPLMRPMVHNLNPPPVQGFSRPQFNQPGQLNPTNFPASPTGLAAPPRHHHPILPGPTVPHMQPRNFMPPHPVTSHGPFPPRPGSQMHIQGGPQRFPAPNQHFANHPGRPFFNSSGFQQTYDPFSPTSAPFNPQIGGNAGRPPRESDPEYDDLMASVGVK